MFVLYVSATARSVGNSAIICSVLRRTENQIARREYNYEKGGRRVKYQGENIIL